MTRACMIGVAAVALMAPAGAAAQGGGATVATSQPATVGGQAAGGGGRILAGAVETKTTIGRPYSAEALTERTQVLGDGNRINVRSTTRVYRDREGRTRREMLDEEGRIRSISISDPVAKASYTLDPKTKIAYTAGGNIVTMMRTPAPDDPNSKTDDLGQQNIEGVMATGKRTTTVIPAGQIGNAQEIRIVSEQWLSDDLQVLVMTKHSDPRSGENVYRLRNILRAEPDQTLFTVPPDYTLQQRGVRRPQ